MQWCYLLLRQLAMKRATFFAQTRSKQADYKVDKPFQGKDVLSHYKIWNELVYLGVNDVLFLCSNIPTTKFIYI
jgi:hypothetical protein